jgi:hypothetical protein
MNEVKDFNKHDINISINDTEKIRGRLFKITWRLELRFLLTRKRSQPSHADFFAAKQAR